MGKIQLMLTTDPRVDADIAKSAELSRSLLNHLMKNVNKGCPGVTETIKWSMPFFDYEGAPLCNMAAFNQHRSFGFWNPSLLKAPEGLRNVKNKTSMGHFDRIASLKDLPADKIMVALVKEAALLNEQ